MPDAFIQVDGTESPRWEVAWTVLFENTVFFVVKYVIHPIKCL
jgi:hypothetical protein